MRKDDIYAAASLAYGLHQMSTERYVLGDDRLTAGFDAHSLGGRLEGGARFVADNIGITPYAAVQAQTFLTPSYGEDDPGGSGFGLSYDERLSASVRGEFGSRFDHALTLGDGKRLNLNARLAYAHDWTIGNPALAASFQALPGSSFTVNAASPPEHLALASLGGGTPSRRQPVPRRPLRRRVLGRFFLLRRHRLFQSELVGPAIDRRHALSILSSSLFLPARKLVASSTGERQKQARIRSPRGRAGATAAFNAAIGPEPETERNPARGFFPLAARRAPPFLAEQKSRARVLRCATAAARRGRGAAPPPSPARGSPKGREGRGLQPLPETLP